MLVSLRREQPHLDQNTPPPPPTVFAFYIWLMLTPLHIHFIDSFRLHLLPCVSAGGGDRAVLHYVSGNAEGARLRRLLLPKVSCQTCFWTGEETRGRLRCVFQDRKVRFFTLYRTWFIEYTCLFVGFCIVWISKNVVLKWAIFIEMELYRSSFKTDHDHIDCVL